MFIKGLVLLLPLLVLAHTLIEWGVIGAGADPLWRSWLMGGTLLAFVGLALGLWRAEKRRLEQMVVRLSQSERQSRELFETMTQGVFYHDANGQVTMANLAAEKLLGLSLEQMRAASLTELSRGALQDDGQSLPADFHPVKIALRTGSIVRNVVLGVYNPQLDQIRWVSVTAVPQFREGQLKPFQAYATFEDITEQKAAEREKNQIFELSQDVICIATFDGVFHFINSAMERLLGYDKAFLVSRPFLELVIPEDREPTLQAMSVLSENQSVHGFENRYRAANGSIVWLSWSSTPDVANRLIYAIAHDITEKKSIEAELKFAKDEAERASRAKSEFLANMSHEIRTPLNAVMGFSELLCGLLVDEKQKRYARSIKTAGSSLLALITGILDLSKIEAGMLVIESRPVALAALLAEMNQLFSLVASEKSLEFEVRCASSVPPLLILDETRIRQVLTNIIGNAIKFTRKGFVTVEASAVGCGVGSVDLVLRVRDSGIGIPSDQQQQIFEAFRQQYGQSNREYGGTGLGLAISRRLVEMMGGCITVDSSAAEGACFTVTLPRVQIEIEPAKGVDKVSTFQLSDVRFRRSSILIVDDIEFNRYLIREVLNASGLDTIEASNGEEAVRMVSEARPDLILMDVRMPVMDGKQAARLLKGDPATAAIPVIALTASVSELEIRAIRESGFDGYLGKPVVLGQLLTALGEHIPHTRLDPNKQVVEPLALPSQPSRVALIKFLEDYLPRYTSLTKLIEMEKIQRIGLELVASAQEFKAPGLECLGDQILTSVAAFDVVAIQLIRGELERYIGRLKTEG